ncbi:MAG: hypothetical protein PV344_00220, partial [Anaplasma sp.]|nr:hypothetical protein [Anaplasma sp.]
MALSDSRRCFYHIEARPFDCTHHLGGTRDIIHLHLFPRGQRSKALNSMTSIEVTFLSTERRFFFTLEDLL